MISIHQSQFLPWLPYYYKILHSDVFVILDDVQYQKNGVQNRNFIKTPNGMQNITVPISANSDTLINQVQIAKLASLRKIASSIAMNYAKTPFFDIIFPKLDTLLSTTDTSLHHLNINLLLYTLELLKCDTKIVYSSDLALRSKKDDLVLDLILLHQEHDYITGSGGLDYMDLKKFYDKNINLHLYHFNHPSYPQKWEKQGFIPNLSIVDLLFNHLNDARNYIIQNGSLSLLGESK